VLKAETRSHQEQLISKEKAIQREKAEKNELKSIKQESSERPKKVAEKEPEAPTRRRHTGGRTGVAAGERRKR
jgi:cell envelope opacity-associated protein A